MVLYEELWSHGKQGFAVQILQLVGWFETIFPVPNSWLYTSTLASNFDFSRFGVHFHSPLKFGTWLYSYSFWLRQVPWSQHLLVLSKNPCLAPAVKNKVLRLALGWTSSNYPQGIFTQHRQLPQAVRTKTGLIANGMEGLDSRGLSSIYVIYIDTYQNQHRPPTLG